MFIITLRCYLPFLFSVSHEYTVEFSRGSITWNDVIILETKGMFACVFCAWKYFLVLISKMVNINRYNTHKQKLSGVLNKF